MKQYDAIIVGQGLAGTLLHYFLEKAGWDLLVIDEDYERSASKVAAGIINPITGRRYVKSWRIDDLLPTAYQTFEELEQLLNINFAYRRPLIRSLFNHREAEDWMIRTGDPSYLPFMREGAQLDELEEITIPVFDYGRVLQSGQINIAKLVSSYRNKLKGQGCLKEEKFNYQDMSIGEGGVAYQEYATKQLLFCEGAKAIHNPFFNYLPFGNAKGEVLIIRLPNHRLEKIFKHRIFIVPLDNDTYWCGSSYNWNYNDDKPTTAEKSFLLERLNDILKVPFEVVTHLSALRPTVKDRRPFLGQHDQFPALKIFNGLGTKGATLGPYWAKHFAEHLTNKTMIDQDVDIKRYEELKN